jgi:LysM repeat protein
VRHGGVRRYLAPLAFLVAVTIAVGLVRAGLRSGTDPGSATTTTTGQVAKRYWKVRAGDTFSVIARQSHVSVKTIERLNPNVSSTSLFVGERIRVR